MSDKYTPTKPCWRPELLNNPGGTSRLPEELLEPMTPGVMFDRYNLAIPDGLTLVRPDSLVPRFTPWYAEQYLFIGPATPGTGWTPRSPQTPQTPQTPKIHTSNQLYQEYYYWYWLLDSLFNYDNEEQEEQRIIEEIRIDAMVLAYEVILQDGKLEQYEDIARHEGSVNIPNKLFLDEVFDKLMTKYVGKRTELNIVTQIKGGCAYAAASGEVKITDFPIEQFPVMNRDNKYDHLDSPGFAGSASPASPVSPANSSRPGGSTRRRMNTIKKYKKKRSRRRTSKRKYRKSRTTRRR
jgi:hypothetical protein